MTVGIVIIEKTWPMASKTDPPYVNCRGLWPMYPHSAWTLWLAYLLPRSAKSPKNNVIHDWDCCTIKQGHLLIHMALIFFDPYEYHIDLYNELCLSVRPAVLCGKTFNVGHYSQTVPPYYLNISHVYRHHWLLPFYTIFTDLDHAWRSQGQCKAKPSFSQTLFIWLGRNLMWRWNNWNLNILGLLLIKDLLKQGK